MGEKISVSKNKSQTELYNLEIRKKKSSKNYDSNSFLCLSNKISVCFTLYSASDKADFSCDIV